MNDKSELRVINASSYRYQNWRMNGEPPVIVNPKADMHALLAWCWGEVSEIDILVDLLIDETPGIDPQDIASLIFSHLQPLKSVLEHLGDMTANAGAAE